MTRIVLGTAPLAAALLALAAVALAGLSQRSALPADVSAYAYGFFLDRYPLFAFALVYGLARVLAAAATPGPAPLARRALGAAVGLALLIALSLYPTFGGLVLRGGFMTGGVGFLNGLPLWLAFALGAAVSALVFGIAMGLGASLAGPWRRREGGWARRATGAVGRGILRFLTLWFAAALLGFARDAGLGPWPGRAMDGGEAARAAALLVLACLPHAALVSGALERARRPSEGGPGGSYGLIRRPLAR